MKRPDYVCFTWLLQHRCTHFLDIRARSLLLAVAIVPQSRSSICYSWNHETAQFHSGYLPNGRLFACWCDTGSLVQIWDTRTGQLVGKFPTFSVYAMVLSPTLIQHSPGDKLIAHWHRFRDTTGFDIYTGHLLTWVPCRGYTLCLYKMEPSWRTVPPTLAWEYEAANLTDEHWHSAHGYKLKLHGMTDRQVMGRDSEPLF